MSISQSEAKSSNVINVQIDQSWESLLRDEFQQSYFTGIKDFLVQEKKNGKSIYPPGQLIFNAFNKTPVDKVRVVILGQDPYHNPGEAMGMCFSVPKDVAIPASLKNIYREIKNDLGFPVPSNGDLTAWTEQGVLLLNAILTVERGNAGSHRNIGWQRFTDAVIMALSAHREGLIFLLWGNFAKSKRTLIDQMKHHVLEAVHPSPLAGKGFQGCGHFSKTNDLLTKQGFKAIDWQIQ